MDSLKSIRQSRGYSCQAMANRLNISKSFYWQIEHNQRRLSYDLALKIAEIFELKPDDIFYDEFKNKD